MEAEGCGPAREREPAGRALKPDSAPGKLQASAAPPGRGIPRFVSTRKERIMQIRSISLALLVAALLSACAHRPPIALEAERTRVEERQGGFLAALGERDVERVAGFFAEDAVLHIAGMPAVRGRKAIQRFYANVFRALSASTATPELLRVGSGADLAYGAGRVTNIFAGGAGPVEYAGKYLLVWERRGGEWWIMAYGVSSDRPDPAR
jgi:ketosteroid isomerase-like protein